MSTAMALALDAKQEWNADAIQLISEIKPGEWITAEHLHENMRPAPHDNQYGPIMRAAARRGLLAGGAYVKAKRRERAGGIIREWRRCDETER